ncbi:zf-TFIIB domain-containing protein [Phyllobacterium sp. TAF24]|uniref:TFIIB-type zinc ribbon-containing protein n=1 Tax=Phyllobacterium sp. TAF24 TaxID=3233068 RepID=UPI003F9B1726
MANVPNIGSPVKGQGLLCPTCKVNLLMGDRQGVEVDFCSQCRGIWLERGKLDEIIERRVSYETRGTQQIIPQAQPAPSPNTDSRSSHGYRDGRHSSGHGDGRRGKHGSLFGRLFD